MRLRLHGAAALRYSRMGLRSTGRCLGRQDARSLRQTRTIELRATQTSLVGGVEIPWPNYEFILAQRLLNIGDGCLRKSFADLRYDALLNLLMQYWADLAQGLWIGNQH